MDVLSDVLRTIRLEGALFLHAEFGEPWCVDAPPSAMMAPALQAGADPLAICHLLPPTRYSSCPHPLLPPPHRPTPPLFVGSLRLNNPRIPLLFYFLIS